MKKLFIFLTCLFAPLLMSAQLPTMDITMVHVDDHYEVRIRPDNSGYEGVFSSILFAVKWDAASGAVGDFVPSTQAVSYGVLPVRSGEIVTVGGVSYAIFAGFGFQTISPNWTAFQEVVMGTFPDDGQTNFQLVNDAWTSANNGDYYLSLNGVDRTGVIYQDFTTSIEDVVSSDLCISLYPNPTEGTLNLVMDLPNGGLLFITVMDVTGKIVQRNTVQTFGGSTTHVLDLSSLTSGQYTIRTRIGDQVSSAVCTLHR